MALGLALGAAIGAQGIGSVFSAFGAGARGRAVRDATRAGSRRISEFTNKFADESKALKDKKLGILSDSDNIFERIGGFIFGGTDTLNNLREAQSEFSSLAAGNTGAFTREIESIVKSALAGTSGAPRGAFENLSAKNLFEFRSQGLQNALTATNQIAGLGSSLINTEFGINDQDFETRLKLRENEVNQLNALAMHGAQTRGSALAGIGNVFNTVGQGIFSAGLLGANNQLSTLYALPSLINSFANFRAAGNQPQAGPQLQPQGNFNIPDLPALPQGGFDPFSGTLLPFLGSSSNLPAADAFTVPSRESLFR